MAQAAGGPSSNKQASSSLPGVRTVLCDDGQGVAGGVPGQAGGAAGQQPLLQALALVHVPDYDSLVAGASRR